MNSYEGKLHRFHMLCIPHSYMYSPSTLCLHRLLVTFANSLDPDQAQQNVGPDLDLNCLTLMVFLKDFFEKMILKKVSR